MWMYAKYLSIGAVVRLSQEGCTLSIGAVVPLSQEGCTLSIGAVVRLSQEGCTLSIGAVVRLFQHIGTSLNHMMHTTTSPILYAD